jgi:hypothetical protein
MIRTVIYKGKRAVVLFSKNGDRVLGSCFYTNEEGHKRCWTKMEEREKEIIRIENAKKNN